MMNFINKLFQSRPDRLSKQAYWEKWEFFELIEDLHKAEKLLSQYKGESSSEFLSAEEFREALIDKIDDIEFGNQTDLSKLWIWFAPTCAWDNFVGIDGQELGKLIFERVDRWKNNNASS